MFLRQLDKKGDLDLLDGFVTISKKNLARDIPYKYVILSEDKTQCYYEDIVTPECRDSSYNDRLLQLNNCKQRMYF